MAAPTQERLAERVLLIGWDAADWQMIRPLMDQGLMPTLQGLMEGGVWGNLATLRPILSPMLWNSIATGKRADKHGILSFAEVAPDGRSIRPATSTSRRCKALWNMLTQQGMTSHVVGWYASHPVEPIRGTMVSNQFEIARGRAGDEWPVPPRSVHPPGLADELACLRIHPGELDAGAILPFAPSLRDPKPDKDPLLGKLMAMLAQTVSIHAVATKLIERDDWDLTAVYYEGIDRFGHEFMHLHPPKRPGVDDAEFAVYSEVMNGIYRFHDMMLQTLLDLAGESTAVVLVSDHGYYSRDDRPAMDAKAGPTDWHRDYGVVVLGGPPFKSGDQVFGAGLLDICPTVLRLLGLPVGEDMDGRPWVEALREPIEPFRIPSWEAVDGECGRHEEEPDEAIDAADNLEALRQLAALGYIEPIGDDAEETIRRTIVDQKMNLAVSLIDARQPARAIPELERLRELCPDQQGVALQLAVCLAQAGQVDRARELVEPIVAEETDRPRAEVLLGALDAASGDFRKALERFRRAEAANPRLPGLHLRLGRVCADLLLWEEADRAFERAREIAPESSGAFAGLCETRLVLGDADGAVDAGLRAVELQYFFPPAHHALGKALLAIGDPERARQAFEVSLRQAPRSVEARLSLADVFRDARDNQQAVTHYEVCLRIEPLNAPAREALVALCRGPLADPERAERLVREGQRLAAMKGLKPLDQC